LDPNFAAAYAALGRAYNDLGEIVLRTENVKKAFELRGRVEESSRLSIESTYYFSTNQFDKAIAVDQEWAQTYPGDSAPHHNLSFLLRIVGRRQEAVREALEARRLQPASSAPIFGLMMAYIELNRFDDAKAAFEEASATEQGTPALRLVRYALAFLQNDEQARQEQVKWALDRPEIGHQIISSESDSEAYQGHLRKADALSRTAVQAAKRAKLPEAAAAYLATYALRDAEIGNSSQARSKTAEALALSSGSNVSIYAALASAAANDPSTAREVAKKNNLEFPLPAVMQGCLSPTIAALTVTGALVEISKGNPHQALDSLTTVSSCELYEGNYLHPVYVRGLAYLKAGEGQQAAGEFQKILDHPGLVWNNILGALAHLQLARAQVMMGDKAAARKSYQDFLTLWKDADPDIPIYKQAKSEYP